MTRPKDLKATGKPLPVIAWANGGCFRAEFPWQPLFDKWAGGGFIVLALSASPGLGPLGQSNVANQRALIDWALKQNETPDSPYFGAIDTKRVIAAGNSCGGVTALGLAAEDPRVADRLHGLPGGYLEREVQEPAAAGEVRQ